MNNPPLSIDTVTRFNVVPEERFHPPRPTYGAVCCAALWNAARDGSATMLACLVTLGGAIGVRALLSHVPGVRHAVMVLTASGNALAATSFGVRIGSLAGVAPGRWAGGALGAGALALTVVAIYQQGEEGEELAVAGLFATMVYSGMRDLLQGVVGRRLFPGSTLNAERALRWETSNNAARHGYRLLANLVTYWLSCAALNGLAARNVVSLQFGSHDQPLEAFSLDTVMSYGFRSLNEAMDAFAGSLLLAGVFDRSIDIQPRWCGGKGHDLPAWWREASARIFMNGSLAAVGWLMPRGAHPWLGATLTAVTVIRGALTGLKPPVSTRADGDCLLHAVAGVVQGEEWVCTEADAVRQRLCEHLVQEAAADDPRTQDLVEQHLQQAVAQLSHEAQEPGIPSVLDGPALVSGLSDDARLAFGVCQTHEERIDAARWLLNNTDLRRGLLRSIADFYRVPRRYLPTAMVPFLAELLERPLSLDCGGVLTHHDAVGRRVQVAVAGAVRIRFSVSGSGDAGNHFERISPQASARQDEPRALHRDEKPSDIELAPLNGYSSQPVTPRRRNPPG